MGEVNPFESVFVLFLVPPQGRRKQFAQMGAGVVAVAPALVENGQTNSSCARPLFSFCFFLLNRSMERTRPFFGRTAWNLCEFFFGSPTVKN